MLFGGLASESQPPQITKHVRQPIDCDEFQKNTAEDFNRFVRELKERPFDVIILLHKWLEYVSQFWLRPIPTAIQELYLKIYLFNL